jgi:hypothetical protein
MVSSSSAARPIRASTSGKRAIIDGLSLEPEIARPSEAAVQ